MITNSIDKAKEVLDSNDVVSIPTETVYGLAGNVFSATAIDKIFRLKNRPLNNPLIVHIQNKEKLDQVAKNIPAIALKLADSFWPGPLTLLLEKKHTIPDSITAGLSSVGVRVPNHKVTLELLEKLDYPLAAPSANPFKAISPTSSKHVIAYFGDELTCVLEGGECEKGVESTIIGFNTTNHPILYRHGAISIEQIENVVGKVIVETSSKEQPLAPGMLSKHYAPKTKIIMTDNIEESIQRNNEQKIGVITFKESKFNERVFHCEVLSKSGDFNEASRNFYNALHRLDELGLTLIISEEMPKVDLGLTLNDRLMRATK